MARGLPPEQRDQILGDLVHEKAQEEIRKQGLVRATPKRVLSKMIQDIGEEVVDPKLGWTRVEAVIRRLFNEAMAGKIQAAEVLLDRGWGKVPTPIDIDITGEVRKVVVGAGLSWDDISSDPILRTLVETSGLHEDELKMLNAGESDGEPRVIDATYTESQSRVDSTEDRGNPS